MITEYRKGMPCTLQGMVGRIIGESDKGSWGDTWGFKCYSIPLFSTPHGTIIETGIVYLKEINIDELERLAEYENQLKQSNSIMYAGKLSEQDLELNKIEI